MNEEWETYLLSDEEVVLFVLDIDNFKRYNDYWGHLKGDECLNKVANCIKRISKIRNEIFVRYGGEEFIILLPYTELSDSITMAERLRTSIEALEIAHTNNKLLPVVTISIGVAAAAPRPDGNYEHLIKQADDALFKAKREGRNRVCSA